MFVMRILFTLSFVVHWVAAAAQWTNFCPNQTTNGTVVDFAEWNGQLVATGFFNKICSTNAQYIARWDGNDWQAFGTGLSDEGHALEVIENELYVAKYQLAADSNWLLKWNGSSFQKIGPALWHTNPDPSVQKTPSVYDVLRYQGQTFICGEFDRAGDQDISGIARWNGTSWDALGAGLSGNIPNTAPIMYPHQMTQFGNDLIVCGNFLQAGGQTVNGIARWDGAKWHPLGAGFNSTVYGVGVYKGELYAGGDFTKSGATTLQRIARWDGTAWVDAGLSFPNGSNPNSYIFVHTLREIGGKLFIAGGLKKVSFGSGTTLACNGIVAFDGQQVDVLKSGISNGYDVEAIVPFGKGILIGAGIINAGYLATYDTSSSAVGEVVAKNDAFRLFPNPASELVFMEKQNDQTLRFQLFNAMGQLLQSGEMNTRKAEISLKDLPVGAYTLCLFSEEGRAASRVLLLRN